MVLPVARGKVAVYSDMDVPDVLIKSDEFGQRIDKYGVAFGGTSERIYENGYAAFSKKGLPLLVHMIGSVLNALNTIKHLDLEYHIGRDSVFMCVERALFNWSYDHNDTFPISSWQSFVGGLRVLPPMGFRDDTHLSAKLSASSERSQGSPAKFFGKARSIISKAL